MSNNNAAINIANLTADYLVPDKMEPNSMTYGNLMGYIRNPFGGQVNIQTHTITITDGGIPPFHEQYSPDFKSRAILKLPLNAKVNPKSQKMIDIITSIDDRMNSPEMREQLFGKNNKDWEYIESIRQPEQTGERERPPHMKLKLDTVYKQELIKTVLLDIDNNEIKAEGSSSLNEEQYYTIDELAKHVEFLSNIQVIISPCKVWTITSKKGKKTEKTYGITWKAKQIKVSPRARNNKSSRIPMFTADDDEDALMGGSVITPETINMESLSNTLTDQHVNKLDEITMGSSSQSDDIGDSSDDDDDDEMIEIKPTKQTKSSSRKA